MMNLDQEITRRFQDCAVLVNQNLAENLPKIRQAAGQIAGAVKNGNKILFFGNGGSAAEAQHFAAEFVNRMVMERKPLPAIALTADSSIITSIGNDRGFDEIFSIQIRALGKKGDLAFGISTSGNSANVIRGLETARELGLYRIGMAGIPGKKIGSVSDLCLWVNSKDTPRVQEVHLLIGHILCELVDLILFGDKDV